MTAVVLSWVGMAGAALLPAAARPGQECPPPPFCTEIYNPHGENIPPAGSTTLPGPKGGQNDDGFYQVGVLISGGVGDVILADKCGDGPSGEVYGTFPGGTTIKFTEANGTDPRFEPMAGNNGNGSGQSVAVDFHVWGNGDLQVCDAANPTNCICCYVPPPPK